MVVEGGALHGVVAEGGDHGVAVEGGGVQVVVGGAHEVGVGDVHRDVEVVEVYDGASFCLVPCKSIDKSVKPS